jgi:hypothetical protein
MPQAAVALASLRYVTLLARDSVYVGMISGRWKTLISITCMRTIRCLDHIHTKLTLRF